MNAQDRTTASFCVASKDRRKITQNNSYCFFRSTLKKSVEIVMFQYLIFYHRVLFHSNKVLFGNYLSLHLVYIEILLCNPDLNDNLSTDLRPSGYLVAIRLSNYVHYFINTVLPTIPRKYYINSLLRISTKGPMSH